MSPHSPPKKRIHPLRKKCPHSELFWSAFSRIRTKYDRIQYSVRMRENMDQNNFEYGHFSRNDRQKVTFSSLFEIIAVYWSARFGVSVSIVYIVKIFWATVDRVVACGFRVSLRMGLWDPKSEKQLKIYVESCNKIL